MRRNLSKSLGNVTVSSIGEKIIIAQRRPGLSENPYRVSCTLEEAEEVFEQLKRNIKLLKALKGTLLE